MILITGATGRTGSVAAKELARRGLPVRALTRNADKASQLATAGVDVAIGDAGDSSAVRSALKGVDKLAIILPNGEAQLNLEKQLADQAVEAGVKHIVKVSSMESAAGARNPVHQAHWASEENIRSKGVAWTMVRPSFYMQNFLGGAATIKAEGKFYFPFGDKGATVLSDARDVGTFVAEMLSSTGHENRSYDVTSGDLLSFRQIGELFSEILGRPISYVAQDPATYREKLSKFVTSQWHLDAVCGIFAEIAAGYVANTSDTFARVMGREPTSLRQFIREHIAIYGG